MSTDDLALVFNPPPGATVRFGSGRVISWDVEEFRNEISWNEARLHDVPVFGGVNALTIQPDDVVALLGYQSPGGVSTWWVLGKIIRSGVDASDLVLQGGTLIVRGSGGVTVEDSGSIRARYDSGETAVLFGHIVDLTDGSSQGYGLLVQADADSGGRDVFRAREHPVGGRQVLLGEETTPGIDGAIRWLSVWSELCQIRAYDQMSIEALDGADMSLDADGYLWARAVGQAALGGEDGTLLRPEPGTGTANVVMNPTTGRISYVSSSRRFKRDIRDLEVDQEAVLQLRPRSWLPGPTVRQCPEWMHAHHGEDECHAGETIDPPEDCRREVGFVAEELDELGLADFVEYDDEGRPASIRYDRLAAALIPVVRSQQAQIDALSARLDALESEGD